LEAVHIEIQTVIMETLKHKVLSVSKSVVRYQKYVHIKSVPSTEIYISTAWGKVNTTLIPAPGKAKCTQAKGYHPISLLFFTQKMMQKLVARHIRDVTGFMSLYIYTNLSKNQASP